MTALFREAESFACGWWNSSDVLVETPFLPSILISWFSAPAHNLCLSIKLNVPGSRAWFGEMMIVLQRAESVIDGVILDDRRYLQNVYARKNRIIAFIIHQEGTACITRTIVVQASGNRSMTAMTEARSRAFGSFA